jgi:hypothetical protein
MAVAIVFMVGAVFLFSAILLYILIVVLRKGMGVKYVYMQNPPPAVVPGEVIRDEDPDDAFFDENDLAAMEAHEERQEFVRTQILVNGVEAGPDGIVPLPKERGWMRR